LRLAILAVLIGLLAPDTRRMVDRRVTSLAIVGLLIKEGREAWSGEEVDD
jgi:hypothetical protein